MSGRISEQDEFLLSQLLDGDLSSDASADLRDRIGREPVLREAYEELVRLDGLLKARRSDQPGVDFQAFHADVMRRIDAEPVAGTAIRFPFWMRVAGPLAAAAVLALLFWFEPWQGGRAPTGADRTLVVQYHRPDTAAPPSAELRVSFRRSAELASAIAEEDRMERNRPDSVVAAGSASPAIEIPVLMLSPM